MPAPPVVESGMTPLTNLLDRATSWWRRRTGHGLDPVPPGQLPDVAAVVARLQELDGQFAPGDGVAAFNRMYLQVTELVGERIEDGFFADPVFMTRLDVVFAGLYLDAVDGRAPASADPCWQPLLECREQPLAPIQFAIAGMNAHINHDLAVAVVRTCRQLGLSPASPGVRSDYDKVTLLLAQVHEQVRQSFLDGLVLRVDRELSPLLTLVGAWSIGRARDAAWVSSGVLWELGREARLAEEFRRSLSRSVGMASRALLVQVAEPV